jgi:uncharacterized delta-60 repeat protein
MQNITPPLCLPAEAPSRNHPSSTRTVFLLFACFALVSSSSLLMAQAGRLDTTFGTGGKVTTFAPDQNNSVNGVAIQSDGKVVVAGDLQVKNSFFMAALVRYNVNGSLDTSFGKGGTVITHFPVGIASSSFGVAIQPDGKIVTGGQVYPVGFGAARYNSNGSIDSSFGNGGTAVTTLATAENGALTLQADGKILVAGNNSIVRFNADGSLDSAFGNSGLAILAETARGIALQSDGRILVTGGSTLSRYNVNGSIDASFGVFGSAGSGIQASAIAVQGDGKIVTAGTMADQLTPPNAPTDSDMLVIRYNTDGSVDQSFGTRGGTLVDSFSSPSNAMASAVVLQPDGKIVVTGQAANGTANSQFAVVRLTSQGALDTSFGTGGSVTTSFGHIDSSTAVALQSDGKIVAAGFTGVPGQIRGSVLFSYAVARYNGH